MKLILHLTSSQVVILGVLSQVGLGLFQYPTTLLLAKAQNSKRFTIYQLDSIMNWLSAGMFCVSMLGIGAILYTGATNQYEEEYATRNMALLGILFVLWGQAVGTTYNTCSSVINFNHEGEDSERRKRIALLSTAVGIGGVLFVVIYYFGLVALPLHSTFFALAVWFLVFTGIVRHCWMKRVRREETKDAGGAITIGQVESAMEASPQPQQQQSLRVLLKSDIVLLTFLTTFIGVGVGGTFLSSIGNMGHELEDADAADQVTFFLLLAFLIAQTIGRMLNALVYAHYDWAYVFAFWQTFCALGIAVFLFAPTTAGAFASSAIVGASFGGFHSCFPVLAATCFPGNPSIDYSQNVGVAMLMSSMGTIAVGQLTTVVLESHQGDAPMDAIYATFVFSTSIQSLSALCALVLGWRITAKRLYYT